MKLMRHRKITPISTGNGSYTVNCLLGNFVISQTKVKNKNVFILYAYSKDKYSQSLVRRFDKKWNREDITYKSLNEVMIAIEKECNSFYNNEIKFYFEEINNG